MKSFIYICFSKGEQFDIIHCSGGSWQFKGIIAGKLAGSKTLWHLNDTSMPTFFRWIFRLIAPKFADGLIVAGKRVKDYYVERLSLGNIPVIECLPPVNTDLFDPSKVEYDKSISKADGFENCHCCKHKSRQRFRLLHAHGSTFEQSS